MTGTIIFWIVQLAIGLGFAALIVCELRCNDLDTPGDWVDLGSIAGGSVVVWILGSAASAMLISLP